MRSMALGALGLGRLVHVHEQNSAVPIPEDMYGKKVYNPETDSNTYLDTTFKELEVKFNALDRIFGSEELDV